MKPAHGNLHLDGQGKKNVLGNSFWNVK